MAKPEAGSSTHSPSSQRAWSGAGPIRHVAVIGAYLLGWYALRMVALQFEIAPDVTIWTPQVALDFVLLLGWGLRYVPAIFVARLLDQHLFVPRDWPLVVTILYAAIYAYVYSGAAALLLRSIGIDPRLRQLRDVLWFTGIAGFVAPLVAAVLQAVLFNGFGVTDWSSAFLRTLQAWAGDATGIVMLAPTLLIALRYVPERWVPTVGNAPPQRRDVVRWPRGGELLEGFVTLAAIGVASWAAYGSPRGGTLDYTYFLFLPLIWIAVRHGLVLAAAAATITNLFVALLVYPQIVSYAENGLALQFGLMTVAHAGVLLGALIQDRPLTAEQRLAAERRAGLAQRFESVGRLASGVAHDFNNLLTGIRGYIHLAIAELPGTSESRALLEEADSGTQQATDLARQLLAFAGKGQGASQQVDVNGLVTQTIRFLRGQIPPAIHVSVRPVPDLPPVEVDPSQLRQVVLNLVLNAAQAIGDTGEGSITAATGVRTLAEDTEPDERDGGSLAQGDYVFLEVADTGCGMDAATAEQIFEPFFTTKSTGHGLGLAAAAGIVRASGGAIRVKSAVGQGTTFTVFLPAVVGVTAQVPATVEAPAVIESAAQPAGDTVLVVDDDAGMRLLAKRAIERWHWNALVADGGAAGVHLFRSHAEQIGCVLVDLRMPGMDGLAVCDRVRQINPTVPLILMSSMFSQEFDSDIARLGIQSTIVKPFELDELHDQIGRALQSGSRG